MRRPFDPINVPAAVAEAKKKRAKPGERTVALLRAARKHVAGRCSKDELAVAMHLLRGSRQWDPFFDRPGLKSRRAVLNAWELACWNYLAGRMTREELRRRLPKGRNVRLSMPARRLSKLQRWCARQDEMREGWDWR